MNLQTTEINELKAELNELNRLKIQEANEIADIEFDIYQMESNFLHTNNPLRSLIVKTNETNNILSQKQQEEKHRIFSNSSLTSKLIAKEIPYCNHIVPVFKPIKPVHTADKNITSPNNAENEIPNKEGGDEEKSYDLRKQKKRK